MFWPVFFILIGVLVFVVFLWLKLRTRKYCNVLQQILSLNTKNLKLEDFLRELELILNSISINCTYFISFLNYVLEKKSNSGKSTLSQEWSEPKLGKVVFCFILKRKPQGEDAIFFRILFDLSFSLIVAHVVKEQFIVQQSFRYFSQMSSFILHDVKNLAQFIYFLSSNISTLKTKEELVSLCEAVKQSMPLLELRADRILNFLQDNYQSTFTSSDNDQKKVSFSNLLQSIPYAFSLKIKGNLSLPLSQARPLLLAMDNILKNIEEKSLNKDLFCFVLFYQTKTYFAIKIIDTGGECKDIDKIFAPFYTTKPGGLGLGLFEAKQIISEQLKGNLNAYNAKDKIIFKITLPKDL